MSASAFTDVVLTDWFFEGIAYAYGMNLMNGTGNKEFAPKETLSRSMLAVILFRLEGQPGLDEGHVPANWYRRDEMGTLFRNHHGGVPGDRITKGTVRSDAVSVCSRQRMEPRP